MSDNLRRRTLIMGLAAAALPFPVLGQSDFPTRPVRLVVPFPAGGSLDNVGRQLSQKLSEMWGQNVLVDNRPGGAAIIGTQHVGSAPSDGYTLLLMANGFVMVPMLMSKAPYDPFGDFEPVTLLARVNQALVAPPSFKPSNVRELIAAAKATPGKLTFASFGNGTSSHLGVELFKKEAGVEMTHVAYKGVAPAMQDVIGGQVDVFLTNLPEILPHVKVGRLKVLGVADEKRALQLPEVPTFAEQGVPGFNVYSWYGCVAPAGTPAPVIQKLHASLVRVLKSPEVSERMAQQGLTVLAADSAAMRKFMQDEQKRYAEPIRLSGAKME